ncbi:MAG: SsrA-binding protein SmpB [Pseudomonadota bacterium]
MSDKNKNSSGLIADNRKARYNYAIEEDVEAGLVLTGTEVKSLRTGKVNISDSHAAEMQGEMWIFNLNIPEYVAGNRFNHDPKRPRKLLLHKKQSSKLLGKIKIKGYTIVPLKMYFNSRGIAKILLGVGKGKKEYEKREVIKERDWQREQRSIMKRNYD